MKLLTGLIFVTLLAACADADAALAQQLRAVDPTTVERVDYTHGGMVDPPRIDIHFRSNVSRAQAERTACGSLLQITKSAVKDHDLEVFVWTSSRELAAASDSDCAR